MYKFSLTTPSNIDNIDEFSTSHIAETRVIYFSHQKIQIKQPDSVLWNYVSEKFFIPSVDRNPEHRNRW